MINTPIGEGNNFSLKNNDPLIKKENNRFSNPPTSTNIVQPATLASLENVAEFPESPKRYKNIQIAFPNLLAEEEIKTLSQKLEIKAGRLLDAIKPYYSTQEDGLKVLTGYFNKLDPETLFSEINEIWKQRSERHFPIAFRDHLKAKASNLIKDTNDLLKDYNDYLLVAEQLSFYTNDIEIICENLGENSFLTPRFKESFKFSIEHTHKFYSNKKDQVLTQQLKPQIIQDTTRAATEKWEPTLEGEANNLLDKLTPYYNSKELCIVALKTVFTNFKLDEFFPRINNSIDGYFLSSDLHLGASSRAYSNLSVIIDSFKDCIITIKDIRNPGSSESSQNFKFMSDIYAKMLQPHNDAINNPDTIIIPDREEEKPSSFKSFWNWLTQPFSWLLKACFPWF